MSDDVSTVEITNTEYQKLLHGFEHAEKMRVMAVEIAKKRAAYDKAKDASLKAKKTLDEALREYQELGEELNDPQQRLPLEVAASKDPKTRKPAEKTPVAEDDDGPEEIEDVRGEVEMSGDGDDYEDVPEDGSWIGLSVVPADDDEETEPEYWRAKSVDLLGSHKDEKGKPWLTEAKLKTLRTKGIATLGDARDLYDGKNEKFPDGIESVKSFGSRAVERFQKGLAAVLVSCGVQVGSNTEEQPTTEPAEETPVEPPATEETPEPESEAEQPEATTNRIPVTVRVTAVTKALKEHGIQEGSILSGTKTRESSSLVYVKNENGDPVSLMGGQYVEIA